MSDLGLLQGKQARTRRFAVDPMLKADAVSRWNTAVSWRSALSVQGILRQRRDSRQCRFHNGSNAVRVKFPWFCAGDPCNAILESGYIWCAARPQPLPAPWSGRARWSQRPASRATRERGPAHAGTLRGYCRKLSTFFARVICQRGPANKTARIVWAVMSKQEVYKPA